MLNHRYVFRPGHLAGQTPKGVAQRFTPTLEDVLMSIDGNASPLSDSNPDSPALFGSEHSR